MENCPLTWNSCSITNLILLYVIQCPAKHLIDSKTSSCFSCLEPQHFHHRWELSAMCVLYKVHKLNHTHATFLMTEGPYSIIHGVRGNQRRKDQFFVPLARTDQFFNPCSLSMSITLVNNDMWF